MNIRAPTCDRKHFSDEKCICGDCYHRNCPLDEETLMASLTRRAVIVCVLALTIMSMAGPASAQGFISPLIGFNFGGDSGCPEISNCEDKRVNWGVALGAL